MHAVQLMSLSRCRIIYICKRIESGLASVSLPYFAVLRARDDLAAELIDDLNIPEENSSIKQTGRSTGSSTSFFLEACVGS